MSIKFFLLFSLIIGCVVRDAIPPTEEERIDSILDLKREKLEEKSHSIFDNLIMILHHPFFDMNECGFFSTSFLDENLEEQSYVKENGNGRFSRKKDKDKILYEYINYIHKDLKVQGLLEARKWNNKKDTLIINGHLMITSNDFKKNNTSVTFDFDDFMINNGLDYKYCGDIKSVYGKGYINYTYPAGFGVIMNLSLGTNNQNLLEKLIAKPGIKNK